MQVLEQGSGEPRVSRSALVELKKVSNDRVVCHLVRSFDILVHVAIGVVVAVAYCVSRAISGEREIDAGPVARIHGE